MYLSTTPVNFISILFVHTVQYNYCKYGIWRKTKNIQIVSKYAAMQNFMGSRRIFRSRVFSDLFFKILECITQTTTVIINS